jgi:hypothetical protein
VTSVGACREDEGELGAGDDIDVNGPVEVVEQRFGGLC